MSLQLKSLLLGILVGVSGVLVALTPAGSALEERVDLNVFFQLRGPIPPPDDVVVIGTAVADHMLPLVPVLEEAALAHAAFPLPRTSQVDAYWVFMTSTGGDPTFPALAVQIYALEAYDDFVRLWEEIAGPRTAR